MPLKDLGFNLSMLNITEILNVTFVSGFPEEDKVNIPELLNYTLVSFSETRLFLELNLTNRLFVSKAEKEDELNV